MKFKLNIFLFSILSIVTLYLLFFRILGNNLAWLSFPVSLIFLKWIDLFILRGFYLYKTFSKQRIELNLKAAGIKKSSFYSILKLRILFISVFSLISFIFILKEDIYSTYQYVSQQFKFTHPYLRIEYPSYSEVTSEEIKLFENNKSISIDTSSFLEIKVKNLKPNSFWKLKLKQININNYNEFEYQLNSSGQWSSSVSSLYEQFNFDKNKVSEENNKINIKNEMKNIEYFLTNGKDNYYGRLEINPTPLPIVKLEPIQFSEQDGEKIVGKLHFFVSASSAVPLSLIVLSVRTKSGYRFDKTIAEFANASQLTFKAESAELVTLGIPFMPEDILYVKALAKTVLADIIGESKELEFPVRTPLQVRKDIILSLETALKNINSMKNANNSEKEKVLDPLSKGAQLAKQIGRSGMIRRNIIESMNFVENINKKNDKFYKESVKKIQVTLDLLKRQQKLDESVNFLVRLQNLKYNISKLQNSEVNYKDVLSETKELQNMALNLNKQLLAMSYQPSFGLTQLEKSIVQKILQTDKTVEKLKETEAHLKQKDFNESQKGAQNATEMGTKHLGMAMQILQQARNRTIQEARKQLQKADNHLEQSKTLATKNEIMQELMLTKQSLDRTPQLGEEFNDALSEAKDEVHASQQSAQAKNDSELEKNTRLAQFAIEKALMSLQNEEESDKELQKEQDARAFRSSMDVLAAQGLLDSSWRKKILEEIARLKSQGEQSDSPMIRYLESRLR
ncbi:hypothetical protein [Fluviispira multicolorata]|uniref:DUF4175 family protein n=1 Tax=Fluviispira multicolorata TaxID=2654512 RepID=A0A833JFJ1_9BACT|nr:hypothetical protein [Fluviispira multicolorata]KAB8033779.1 hypothetical protein GCL57_03465 [Fluviispira multicolorata]